MAQRLDKVLGYFDVRDYSATLPREQRRLKADTEIITFITKFPISAMPEGLHAGWTTTKDEGGEQVTYAGVKFKIGQRCIWHKIETVDGKRKDKVVARPTNAELDGTQFEVCLIFNELHGDPALKQASGYWVNDILWQEKASAFADMEDADTVTATVAPATTPEVPAAPATAPAAPMAPTFAAPAAHAGIPYPEANSPF